MKKLVILSFFSLFLLKANAQEPNDCVNAVTVCGNGNFQSNASGIGNIQEVSGCGGFEHNSLWLRINIVQSGTLGFDLIPSDPDILVDYDFWVYGPNRICSNLGNPIRCATTNPNAAGLPNNHTGINGSTTLTQTGPGANGNGYVYWLNVTAGEFYYIAIDRPVGDGGFEIQWTGTATAGNGAFPSPPDATPINDLLQCSSTPNIAVFDLNSIKSSINPDLVNNTIEFYASLADAVDGINPLPGIYANTTNPQQIYAKVKSYGTDCYSLVDFNLVVTPIPDASISASNTAICSGEDVTFTITGTPNANVNYTINGGATQSILLDATGIATIIQTLTTDTTIDLQVAQILNGANQVVCSQNLNVDAAVTVTTNTIPAITNNSPVCEDEDGTLEFTGGDPNATITYSIDNGASATFNLDATGAYTLTLPSLTTTTVITIESVTSATAPFCVTQIGSIETITVNPLPTVVAPNPLFECNNGVNPNSAPFDLDAQSAAISNNDPNVTVSYYETMALATIGDPNDALLSPYDSTSANQTIYVRVENAQSCVAYTTLNLQVIDAPIANVATPLVGCDAASQGYGTFDLSQAVAEITAGNTQAVTVSYHLSLNDAENNANPITDFTTFQNTTPYYQAIFVRVSSQTTNCYSVVALDLVVYDIPTIGTVQSFTVCDDATNDGIAQFDLNSQTPILLAGATDITISYHLSQADADTNSNALISPYTNISNPQTIFVRAENNFNADCFETTTFNLSVNPLPTVIAPTNLAVCDDNVPDGLTSIDLSIKNVEISGGNPSYNVSYYVTQGEADSGSNALAIPYTNTSNPQQVYVRVENSTTGCYDTTVLTLEVEQAPVANVPTPLAYCDPDSDGFGVFTLSDVDTEITGGVAGLTVSYHETMADAENDVNALISPYNNIVANTQTVYARVESATIATDCATIVPLVLIVNPTPQLGVAPTALEVCDDISADGIAQFDLTSKESEILQNLSDPSQYTVSYYATQADAAMASNAIATPNNYTNTVPFTQTLWVRVDDNGNGCYKLTTLDLIVNALPVLVQPTPLELCDDHNPGDEMEAFTLEEANAEILNGQTGITLTYYETQADADAGSNSISSPYTNTVNPQTVFVRAENNSTGCMSTITLLLRVNPVPSPATPTAIEVCDEDNDGYASFDLETRTQEIINGELDIAITYHETMDDANTGQNPLVSPYNNIVPNTQTVYARAENTVTGCYSIVALELNVLPSPVVPLAMADYVVCDTDSNGIAQFDLTTQNAIILGTQNPSNFTLTYHLSQANADAGTNPIVNVGNYTNISNPQTIYIRLESVANGCVTTGAFDLRVELPPVAVQPTPLQVCDDDVADEITMFDLTIKDNEITGGEASWSTSYYTTNADAQADTNAIDPATAYTNMSVNGNPANPQTLYVRVTDTDTGCTDFTTLTIRVLPNPTPSLDPSDLELCDDINTGDGQEVFDLTLNEAYIINGESGVTASYYETPSDAEEGTNAISDPTQYTNTNTDYSAQTIYVRVTNDITGCYTIVNFNISVHPLPEVVAVTDYIICELNTDGAAGFALTTKDAEVLNGQDPTMFNVSYHATQADADDLMNALVSPYTNTSNPQQIFVAITNVNTGCSISTQSFYIEVQEAAVANAPVAPYEICDTTGDNDGFAQFDLTTQNAEVLGGQDPSNYIVTYYASDADAMLGVNPIPTLYENIENPQVIYVRVDNDTPNGLGQDSSICFDVAALTLQVDLLPIFDLEDSYILCLDTNGTEVVNPPVLDTGLSASDYSFEWSLDGVVLPTEIGSSLAATQAGTYSVEVTNIATSCSNTDSAEVIASTPPTVVATVSTQAFSEIHVIEAVATGTGDYEYSLDNGAWQSSGTFSDVTFGEHTIRARDIKGCGEASTTVTVMDYPHYFTPNGDGYHDTWNIVGLSGQPSAKIYIFDRFGKLLKQISPSGQGWNGTYNGEQMPSSDYWFTVEYVEPTTNQQKEFKAHFTLKR
ncbi:MAG: T9SS type B sorting domain-containing protein [Gelidibacter sp.]